MTQKERRGNGDRREREPRPLGPTAEAIRRRVVEEVRERPGLALATAFGLGAMLAFAPQRWVGAALAAGARIALARGALDLRSFLAGEDPTRH
jgi:hypothetical protein